ncbi:MAG: exonuclease subunit SbcD [Bacteroidales bacterium]|nr:exonuclease subunit SbcD [Bacteroidales bacterium]
MRILHTSDWHLGKRLERFPRHEEQVAVLEEILEIADREMADLIVVAGDLFDTFNPPAESQELFYRLLKKMAKNGKRPVVAIAGNHDMAERIDAPDPLAKECGIIFAGSPLTDSGLYNLGEEFTISRSEPGFIEIQLPGKEPVRILLTPYVSELRLHRELEGENKDQELRDWLQEHWKRLSDKYCDSSGINILLTHLLFMNEGEEAPEEPEDERSINHIGGAPAIYTSAIPENIQYTALGHLHRYQFVRSNPSPVVYSGSPLPYSFSEAGQTKQAILVDLESGARASIRAIPLKSGRRLERKRFEEYEAALSWLEQNPDTLVELTIVSDNFLSGLHRRTLNEVHKGIVSIIPEVRHSENDGMSSPEMRVVQSDMNILFSEYFMSRKGQAPGPELQELFREVLSGTDENEAAGNIFSEQ